MALFASWRIFFSIVVVVVVQFCCQWKIDWNIPGEPASKRNLRENLWFWRATGWRKSYIEELPCFARLGEVVRTSSRSRFWKEAWSRRLKPVFFVQTTKNWQKSVEIWKKTENLEKKWESCKKTEILVKKTEFLLKNQKSCNFKSRPKSLKVAQSRSKSPKVAQSRWELSSKTLLLFESRPKSPKVAESRWKSLKVAESRQHDFQKKNKIFKNKTWFSKKKHEFPKNRQTLGDFGRLWATLGDFGRLWATLADFGRLWATLGDFGRLWRTLGDFGRLWPTLDRLWPTLGASGGLWLTFADFGRLWIYFGRRWLTLNDFGWLWTILTHNNNKKMSSRKNCSRIIFEDVIWFWSSLKYFCQNLKTEGRSTWAGEWAGSILWECMGGWLRQEGESVGGRLACVPISVWGIITKSLSSFALPFTWPAEEERS